MIFQMGSTLDPDFKMLIRIRIQEILVDPDPIYFFEVRKSIKGFKSYDNFKLALVSSSVIVEVN